jgi:hypothetical protein
MTSKMKIEGGGKVWRNSTGNLHRLDGPAYEGADGVREWWVNGEQLTKDQFDQHYAVRAYQARKEVEKFSVSPEIKKNIEDLWKNL